MATVREGNKAALVVVDVQVGVMADAWDATRVVGNVALAVNPAFTSSSTPPLSKPTLRRYSQSWE